MLYLALSLFSIFWDLTLNALARFEASLADWQRTLNPPIIPLAISMSFRCRCPYATCLSNVPRLYSFNIPFAHVISDEPVV